LTLACGLGLLGCLSGVPATAQEAPERPGRAGRHAYINDEERREQIEQRIREHFSSMLRSELALSDEQAEAVLPAMQELEATKREIGRERRDVAEALREGMDEGSTDAELESLLLRLEQLDDDLRSTEKVALAGIDAELNVRQRVKLRFFVQHFRNEIRDRMHRGPQGPPPEER
jgi:hypothetical protein